MRRFTVRPAVILSLLSAAGAASAQCQTDLILPNDPTPSGLFAGALSLGDDVSVFGAVGVDAPSITNVGAAYVFARSGLDWSQAQKLLPGDITSNKDFGASVSMDGDYLAVGASGDDYASKSDLGSVYIYHRVSGSWIQEANILVPAANQVNSLRFGESVHLNGSTIAIGAAHDTINKGAVWVFTRSGTVWSLQQRLQPAGLTASALFGTSVDVLGDTLAVGAPGDDSVNGFATGAAFVFSRTGSTWTLREKVVGNQVTSSDQFGSAVSLAGIRLAVTAPYENNGGGTYVFRQLDINTWAQEDHIQSPQAPVASRYGAAVTLDHLANRLAISADSSGNVSGGLIDVYERINGDWVYQFRKTSPVTNAQFGAPIALRDNVLMVGAMSYDPPNNANAGAAVAYHVFDNGFDNCANAPYAVLGSQYGCTAGMASTGPSVCAPNAGSNPDVFYRFSPVCTGRYQIDTAGSVFDTVLSVSTGCPASAATTIACNDDSPGLGVNSQVIVDVARTEVVYIRVSGWGANPDQNQGAFQLNITALPPLNDVCSTAQDIDVGLTSFGTCLAHTDSPPFLGCGDFSRIYNDVWFKFVSGCTGTAHLDLCNSPEPWDSMIAVFAGPSVCAVTGPSVVIACNDDSCGLHPSVDFSATAGQTYYIRVGGFNEISRGSGILNLEFTGNCPADFNQDGGIDGSDVQAFFADWEAGLPSADVNCDGGVDGADVDTFFGAWENGGCN